MKRETKHDADKMSPLDAPSDVAFWTVVQRYFSFEEPSSRWSKHRKSLQKQLKKKRGGASELESMTLKERSQIFSQIFGNWNRFELEKKDDLTTLFDDSRLSKKEIERTSKLVSVFLAFEDITRFNKLAFDLWMLESDTTIGNEDFVVSNYFSSVYKLSESERLWLVANEACTINWARLLIDGPWQEEPTALFIRNFVSQTIKRLLDKEFTKLSIIEQLKRHIKCWSELLEIARTNLPGDFLPRNIVLVEGASEKVLLPVFCRLKELDVCEKAIEVRPCGGAKQVVKQYLNLRDIVELPIVSVLDSDVFEEAQILEESLRELDILHVLRSGELEDTYSTQTFISLINLYIAKLGSTSFLTVDELKSDKTRVEQMKRVWRRKKLGEFDKVEFAKVARDNLESSELPLDFDLVVESIKEATNANRKLRFAKQ